MLVAEGMNSRRSRRALVLCMAPHAGAWGWGALSLLSLLMWWSWLRSNPAFEPTLLRKAAQLSVRLVCAHSPNSPIGAALDASGAGVGCGATSARPYCARRASDCAIFSLASACRASAFCIASRVARFSLLAVPHAPARLGVAYAPPSP